MEHLDTHMVKTYLSLYLRFEFSGKSHKLMAFNSFSKNRKLKLYGCCSDSAKSTRHWKDRILSLRGNNIVKEEQMGRNNECEDSVNTTLTIFRTTDSSSSHFAQCNYYSVSDCTIKKPTFWSMYQSLPAFPF